jgi:hypothetical protein
LLLALREEDCGKLASTLFRQACPTRDVFAAVQDAEMSTEKVGQGSLFPSEGQGALWGEEPFAETVQRHLFWCAPQLTRLCG